MFDDMYSPAAQSSLEFRLWMSRAQTGSVRRERTSPSRRLQRTVGVSGRGHTTNVWSIARMGGVELRCWTRCLR